MKIISSLRKRVIKLFLSSEQYAKFIGVNIGTNNFIPDKDCWSSEPYLITVGSNCQITTGVRIFTHGGGNVVRNKYPDFDVFGKVTIGDWVYIGTNSLIMPGVTIGDGVLIAAGSVVTKSVPSGVVVGGNPAKIISTIDNYIKNNVAFNLNSKRMGNEEKRIFLQQVPEEKFLKKRELQFIK
jgi:acetyltransferase-like isoleucine patch superfamily enzyme